MGKKTPKAPTPPDPVATAAAQAASNRETAIAQRDLNLINQVTPYGNLSYEYGLDPGTGIRPATATQTLSPEQQILYNLATKAETGLGQLANSQIAQVQRSLGQPFSIAGALRAMGGPQRVNQINTQRNPGLSYGVPVGRR